MPFPIIPLMAIAAMLGGGGALLWYSRLPKEEQDKADQEASELAGRLFKKALDALTQEQAAQVHAMVKKKFRK